MIRPGAKHPTRLRIGRYPAMPLHEARAAARVLLAGECASSLRSGTGRLDQFFLSDALNSFGPPANGPEPACVSQRPERHGKIAARAPRWRGPAPRHCRAHAQGRQRVRAGACLALTKAVLGRFWSWLAENDLTETDPVRRLAVSFAIPKRERAFSDAEVKALWFAEVGDDLALVLRLLLWTGARETEIGGLCRIRSCRGRTAI